MENENIIQPQIPSRISKRLIVLVILFMVIAVVGFGAYVLGARTQAPPTVQQTPLAVVQPTPTLLPDEASAKAGDPTANWKTYSNKKYGFEIKYPNHWKVWEGEIVTIYEGENPEIPAPYKFSRVKILTEENPNKILNIEKWWDDKYLSKPGETISKSDPTKLRILRNRHDLEFLKAQIYTMDDKETDYVLSPSGIVITLSFSNETKSEIIDQILSAFRFTN